MVETMEDATAPCFHTATPEGILRGPGPCRRTQAGKSPTTMMGSLASGARSVVNCLFQGLTVRSNNCMF